MTDSPPETLRGGSRIGLGLAALGRPAYITTGRDSELGDDRSPAKLRSRTHAVLDAAYGAGVRYFDVARSYGCAESFLADWLSQRGLGRADVGVGSKWGYTYVGGWRVDAECQGIEDGKLAVEARADGVGRARPGGPGLLGLHDRLAALDGSLRVEGAARRGHAPRGRHSPGRVAQPRRVYLKRAASLG
jgi:hypothetical protein